MSLLSAKVFCPCSEKVPLVVRDEADLQLSSFPTTITDSHTLHPLSFLNFCDQCQAIKCRKCVELEVITKFCPRCMHEMKPEHSFCSRNCFDCPWCASNIHISQKSTKDGDSVQKTFHFKCTTCPYTYQTPVLEKPRSLARVVRNEINELKPVVMFSDLEKYYIQTKQIQEGQIDIPKSIIKQCAEMKIKNSEIPEFIRRSTIKKFDMESDLKEAQERSIINTNSDAVHYDEALRHAVPQFIKSSTTFPISTKLRAKHSKRCKACRGSLMKPDQDPTSVKFYKVSNAIDSLPSITVKYHPTRLVSPTPGSTVDYVLCFQNPLDKDSHITLSSTTDYESCKVQLPVSAFKLGGKPENSSKLEVIIKSTPSIELTRSTKLGRVELMSRVPVNYDQEGVYERSANYCVIPVKVTIGQSMKKGEKLSVPVLLSVRSEGVACGYWIMVQLGLVE